MHYTPETMSTKVEGAYDVAICGGFAGIAAAITDDFAALDVSALQKTLVQDGVALHEDEQTAPVQ